LLLRNDILLNYKKYLLTIAGAFILGFIVVYFNMPKVFQKGEPHWIFGSQRYLQVFIMCLIGLGAFVGSSFSELSNKVKTTNYLLLPASTFEKYLTKFFIHVIAGTIIFLIIFWIDAHLARYAAISNMKATNNELLSDAEKEKYVEVFNYSMFLIKTILPTKIIYWNWFEGSAMIVGLFTVGMYFFNVKIFFKKLGLIKTAISLIAIIYLLFVLMMLFSQLFYPETKMFNVSNRMDYRLPNGILNVEMWMYLSAYFISLFLIPLGYFKLKEKQL
jgi:hypothetical protein